MFIGEAFRQLTPEKRQGQFLQPKKEIGDLVEQLGVLVAPRYPWTEVESRVAAGEIIIARSEHRDELAGPSGLFDSVLITPETLKQIGVTIFKNRDGIEEQLIAYLRDKAKVKKKNNPDYALYCGLTEKNPDQYLATLTYSAWKYIPGNNVIMAKDPTIQGRYHMLIKPQHLKSYIYYVNDVNGYYRSKFLGDIANFYLALFENTQAVYTTVNEAIDTQHCAIMEFQVGFDGKVYFLQYNRGRKPTPATHDLTGKRDGSDTKVWTENVLGATPPEGIEMVAFFGPQFQYSHIIDRDILQIIRDNNISGSASELYHQPVLMEYLVRNIQAQVLFEENFRTVNKSHMNASPLFKPPVTIIVPFNRLNSIVAKKERGNVCSTHLRVVSDGKQGYVEALPLNRDSP